MRPEGWPRLWSPATPKSLCARSRQSTDQRFLHEVQLTEVGPEDNEICDDLTPPSHADLYFQMEEKVRELSGIRPGVEDDAVQWRRKRRGRHRRGAYLVWAEYRSELAKCVAEWIPTARARVLSAVRQRKPHSGCWSPPNVCPVQQYLAHDVANDLIQNDLHRKPAVLEHYAEAVPQRAGDAGKKVKHDDPRLHEAVTNGVNAASYVGTHWCARKPLRWPRSWLKGLCPAHCGLCATLTCRRGRCASSCQLPRLERQPPAPMCAHLRATSH